MAVVLLPLWDPGDTYWRLVGLNTAGWYVWPECERVHVQVMAAAQASPDSVLSVRASHLHLVTGPALHTPCAPKTLTPGHATQSALQEVCLLAFLSQHLEPFADFSVTHMDVCMLHIFGV